MTQEELLEHVREAYKELNGGEHVKPLTLATTFEDLNLDSLEIVELAITVEDRIGARISGDIVDGARTIGDLITPLVSES